MKKINLIGRLGWESFYNDGFKLDNLIEIIIISKRIWVVYCWVSAMMNDRHRIVSSVSLICLWK